MSHFRWISGLCCTALMGGLVACSTLAPETPCSAQRLPRLVGITNFDRIFRRMAAQLCEPLCSQTPQGVVLSCDERQLSHSVMVPDFLDLQTYTSGPTGLYMGEQMRAALSMQCRSKIAQIDFGKYFKLTQDGWSALTRNPSEIQHDELKSQDVVVGTYSFQGNKLSVFVRRIQGSSGVIQKMVSNSVTYICRGDEYAIDPVN